MYRFEREKGVALIITFIVLVSLTVIALAFVTMVNFEIRSSGAGLRNMKAFYIAEAGLARARWALTTGEEPVGWGEEDISFGEGTYTVTTTDNRDGTFTITSEGYIPDDINPIVKRKVIERDIPVSATNLSLAATAFASSESGEKTADKANDGDTGTRWESESGNGSWLALDFGSPAQFDKVIFDEFGDRIVDFGIQHSGDNITWQAVTDVTETTIGSVTVVTFDIVSDRYVRIFISNTAHRPSIKEFELYYIAGAENITLEQGQFVTSW